MVFISPSVIQSKWFPPQKTRNCTLSRAGNFLLIFLQPHSLAPLLKSSQDLSQGCPNTQRSEDTFWVPSWLHQLCYQKVLSATSEIRRIQFWGKGNDVYYWSDEAEEGEMKHPSRFVVPVMRKKWPKFKGEFRSPVQVHDKIHVPQ
jgi:hypothetical protein